jgi:shikimate dehydrogenase
VTSPNSASRHRTVAAVIGSPVAHSLSPVMHNAAFAALAVDWTYVAFEVRPGEAGQALAAMRTLRIGGLSVTMPHKRQVAESVDRLEPAASLLESANTVWWDGEQLVGASTDGDGWVSAAAEAGLSLRGKRLGVIGAGGAARSIVDAAARAGAAEVVIVNRSAQAAESASALASIATVGVMSDLASADVVVNATSVGMGDDALPIDPALLSGHQVVADIVYHPRRTALLRAAESRGCQTIDGLGMLAHQAVLQQERWLGVRPDPGVLRAAAEAELRRRGQ